MAEPTGADTAVAVPGRPLMLVRYRPGVVGETARVVHLVPLPASGQTGAVGALCGALLRAGEIERVSGIQGMPCSQCTLTHLAISPPPPAESAPAAAEGVSVEAGPAAASAVYRSWGWPVTVDCDQIRLALDHDTVALTMPVALATEVAAILSRRRCTPLVLAHPDSPGHRVLLAGEPYGVVLCWPPGVCRLTGTVLLPPTATARGPVTWVHPPDPLALQLCREIDLVAALHTAQNAPDQGCARGRIAADRSFRTRRAPGDDGKGTAANL